MEAAFSPTVSSGVPLFEGLHSFLDGSHGDLSEPSSWHPVDGNEAEANSIALEVVGSLRSQLE